MDLRAPCVSTEIRKGKICSCAGRERGTRLASTDDLCVIAAQGCRGLSSSMSEIILAITLTAPENEVADVSEKMTDLIAYRPVTLLKIALTDAVPL